MVTKPLSRLSTAFKGLRTVVLTHEDNNWDGFWVKVLYAWPYTVWRLESGVTTVAAKSRLVQTSIIMHSGILR